MSYAWTRLTERQQKRLEVIAAELAAHGMNVGPGRFDLALDEETRPGRGHDVTWWVYDEEKIAQGRIDPYGNGSGFGVADVLWTHTGDDCDCDVCEPPDEAEELTADEATFPAVIGRDIETVTVAGGVL